MQNTGENGESSAFVPPQRLTLPAPSGFHGKTGSKKRSLIGGKKKKAIRWWTPTCLRSLWHVRRSMCVSLGGSPSALLRDGMENPNGGGHLQTIRQWEPGVLHICMALCEARQQEWSNRGERRECETGGFPRHATPRRMWAGG